MKQLCRIIFAVAVISASTSCMKGTQALRSGAAGGGSGDPLNLKITLRLPETEANIDIRDVEVRIESKTLGISLLEHPDASGVVNVGVAPDKYDVLAAYYNPTSRVSANGYFNEFLLCDHGIVGTGGDFSTPEIEIPLSVSLPSPIVIREFYFHGSQSLEGNTYTKDRYLEIYNNNGAGGADYYLDSLCIAAVYPYNSTGANNAFVGLDTMALAQMYWMVPGNGRTYKLAPGESAVVACLSAVDHSGRAVSGLHLEKAHFGCYDEALTGHEIAAGVNPLKMTMCGMGTAWALSIHSPALVLFRPEGGVAEYAAHPEIWERYEPGKTSGTKYWFISKDWIIDGIECYDTPNGAVKRLPSTVDASYVCMKSAHYSGKCVTRRLEHSNGGIDVFMDTNNSQADFLTDQELAPRLKQ